MKPRRLPALLGLLGLGVSPLRSAEGDAWVKSLKSPAERGTLETRAVDIRGDTGRWRDEALLQAGPPPAPADAATPLALDIWADRLLETKARPAASGDTWLVFRTRQLDDNDRVWIEKIERDGRQFRVTLRQAIWRGHYWKSFTYYRLVAVNLGKLPPGAYRASWTVEPLAFSDFEDPKKIQGSRSKNEQPAKGTAGETLAFEAAFTVAAP